MFLKKRDRIKLFLFPKKYKYISNKYFQKQKFRSMVHTIKIKLKIPPKKEGRKRRYYMIKVSIKNPVRCVLAKQSVVNDKIKHQTWCALYPYQIKCSQCPALEAFCHHVGDNT